MEGDDDVSGYGTPHAAFRSGGFSKTSAGRTRRSKVLASSSDSEDDAGTSFAVARKVGRTPGPGSSSAGPSRLPKACDPVFKPKAKGAAGKRKAADLDSSGDDPSDDDDAGSDAGGGTNDWNSDIGDDPTLEAKLKAAATLEDLFEDEGRIVTVTIRVAPFLQLKQSPPGARSLEVATEHRILLKMGWWEADANGKPKTRPPVK